jgi:hypothetical protein
MATETLPGYDDWKTHNPDDDRCKWGFAWAETCSRPRPGEFGGGAFVLHFADGSVDSVSLSGWLRACLGA